MSVIAGQHALVTGGSRGLGLYVAGALSSLGANVTITARSEATLEEAAVELSDQHGHVEWVAADVSDDDSRAAMLERATAGQGPVDILVNNAGIEAMGAFASMPPDLVAAIARTNFVAPLMLSRAVLPGMLERGRGHVVMMSSLGGKKGSPYSATYASTKAALIAWTSSLRQELKGSGVGASVIVPGFVSGVGMFADTAEVPPKLLKTSTPDAVADAVVRAITEDRAEMIVNPGPKRLLQIADAVSPRLMTWLLGKTGVYDYYRRQADIEDAARQTRAGQ